jgi:hypothetical protein
VTRRKEQTPDSLTLTSIARDESPRGLGNDAPCPTGR